MTDSVIPRSIHAQAILGPELTARLSHTRVLLVGAGGIGCELLKNLVLVGFGDITLLDLDTIDLSNLNRQFLFRKKDVKQSKAMVAAQTAGQFNPNVRIHPIHGNIKEPQFDLQWFKSFDLVLNALDNLDARRHVNKMCMAAQVPLVESGTAGYLGQVQPILKDRTECFDCMPKDPPKSFPVCTIRSTPSQPIHCIVWAKSYLMSQLFGEDENASVELDEAERQGENADEISALRREAQAFQTVRAVLRDVNSTENAARLVFQKIFNADIRNLLTMTDMWRSRVPPTPLDFDSITQDADVSMTPTAEASSSTVGLGSKTSNLKDQKVLSLADNLDLFVSSINRLARRLQTGEETIDFDKDDDDTLDFVTAAANLRSHVYGISKKTRWEVKEMAGNIIPAIATTNAIVSGLIVLQALHLLRKSYDKLKSVHILITGNAPLSSNSVFPPNPKCGICRDTYSELLCDPSRTKLGDVVEKLLGDGEEEGGIGPRDVAVYEDKRLLLDPDFDDNADRTLESLNVTRGKFLTIVDEDGEYNTISVAIGLLPPNHLVDQTPYILPTPLPHPGKRPKEARKPSTPPARTPPISRKRTAPDDDHEVWDVEPTPKRSRTAPLAEPIHPNGQPAKTDDITSPQKKQRLETEGVVIMENPKDNYIVIDDD